MLNSKQLIIKLNHTREYKHRMKLINQILELQSKYWEDKSSKGKYVNIYVYSELEEVPMLSIQKAIVFKNFYITKGIVGYYGISKLSNTEYYDYASCGKYHNTIELMMNLREVALG